MQRLPIRIRHMEVVAPVDLRQASFNLQLEVIPHLLSRIGKLWLRLELIRWRMSRSNNPQLEVMNRKTPRPQKLQTLLPSSSP